MSFARRTVHKPTPATAAPPSMAISNAAVMMMNSYNAPAAAASAVSSVPEAADLRVRIPRKFLYRHPTPYPYCSPSCQTCGDGAPSSSSGSDQSEASGPSSSAASSGDDQHTTETLEATRKRRRHYQHAEDSEEMSSTVPVPVSAPVPLLAPAPVYATAAAPQASLSSPHLSFNLRDPNDRERLIRKLVTQHIITPRSMVDESTQTEPLRAYEVFAERPARQRSIVIYDEARQFRFDVTHETQPIAIYYHPAENPGSTHAERAMRAFSDQSHRFDL